MKQPIKPEDIRKGDLIREERTEDYNVFYSAVEYRATEDKEAVACRSRIHFLLDRPEPPFEPYWGMVIANPQNAERAVYIPNGKYDHSPWMTTVDGLFNDDTETDAWAKQKLAEGWVVSEKPEGVQ